MRRSARRFVFTKNTAFGLPHKKRPQAQKQQNTKNTADKQESRVSEQGTTATAEMYFFFNRRKGEFLFFPLKKNQKVFRIKHFENGGLLRFSAKMDGARKESVFNSFFVKTE